MVRIKMLFLVTFVCMGLNAQEVSTQEEVQKKKEINNIKLGEQAMYAEVVELASDDFEAVSLAQQKTINKLQNNVIEACAHRMNITKEQAKEIFDIIDDKCQNVVIKKGDMVRVFAYIAKDAVGLSRKKAKQKDIDEIFGSEEDADSVMTANHTAKAMNLLMGTKDSIDNVTKPSVAVAPIVQQAAETAQQVAQQTLGQNVAQPAQTVVVVQQPAQNVATNTQQGQTIVVVQQPVATTTPVVATATASQPVVVAAPVEPKPVPVVEVSVPELCQTIISKGDFNNVRRYLEQEKTYHKLMYGPAKQMQRPELCYIILTDKTSGRVVAVLDKGQSERMNFVTKKMDHFRNYQGSGYRAIFVQEY